MIPLTADDTRLLKELQQFPEPVGVYDTSGKLFGLFVPVNPKPASNASNRSSADSEELKRRLANERAVGLFSDLVQRLRIMTEESKRRKAAGEPDFTLEEAKAYFEMLKNLTVTKR